VLINHDILGLVQFSDKLMRRIDDESRAKTLWENEQKKTTVRSSKLANARSPNFLTGFKAPKTPFPTVDNLRNGWKKGSNSEVLHKDLWYSVIIEHNILRFQILGSSVKETKEPLAPMQSESLAPSWGTTPNKNT